MLIRFSLLLFVSMLLLACNAQVSEDISEELAADDAADSVLIQASVKPTGTYNEAKLRVKKEKASRNSGKDFEDFLLNDIIPHWYGTEWDFNGYTAVPNQGVIACGYFVSTTLLHMGINVDRYKLAQQAGLHEAQSLALGEENYRTIYGIDSLLVKLKREYVDGIYFVGLDNHVGYLYIKNQIPYFIHSNYIEDKVMIERAEVAPAFQSGVYVVAELSTNEAFLERWRTGAVVPVIRP
jgi:hypothetical protein